MDEQWRPVAGLESAYEVSNIGRVRSLPRSVIRGNGRSLPVPGRILKINIGVVGYGRVNLGKGNTRLVHHLVAEAFLGPRPDGWDVCHNDGNPTNNVSGNLRYDSRQNNLLDKRIHGTDHNTAKQECPYGHPYDLDNTYQMPSGSRACRKCARRRQEEWRCRASRRDAQASS